MGAVITKSGQTTVIAGMTRFVMSAMNSFQTTSSPADCAMTVDTPSWDFGDGTTGTGFVVEHQWATSGTKTVTLTVPFKDGTVAAPVTTTVVVAATPSFSGFTKYVDATRPDDTGNGNTPLTAYKTLNKAIDTWTTFRGGTSTGFAFGQILLKMGQTHSYDGTSVVDFGPLFVSSFGTGARPLISCTSALDGVGFPLSRGGHDNLYDNPVYWKGVDIAFNQNHNTISDIETLITMAHVATQLEDCIVTNAGILMSLTGGTTPHGASLYNVDVSNSYRNGVFFSAQFAVIEQSNIHDNGHINDRDNEIYTSAGSQNSAVLETQLSQLVNVTTSGGLNCSGVNKLYIRNLRVDGCRTAFGPGGNDAPPGEVTQDVVCDGLIGTDINGVGIYANYLNRVSVRNPQLFRCIGPAVRLQSYNSGQRIDQFEVLNPSFSLCTDGISADADGDATDGQSTNVRIENMILTMPSGGTGVTDHLFFMLKTQASAANYTLKNNQYLRVGDTASSVSFAQVGGYSGGATISFNEWVEQISHEMGSHYGDPLFVNANSDLTLQSLSPCIDAGFATGIRDALGVTRPQGVAYDMGALELISSGTSVSIAAPVMSFGFATSPVIIPCFSGSGQISPFMRGLLYGHSTHDLPAANFERWADVAANFACWGNGEPVSYVDEEGVTVGAHQGRVSTTKTGPTAADLSNFLFTGWFQRFIPKTTAFNTLLSDESHESKPLTSGTGEERRLYYTPAVRRAVYHSNPAERQVGWDATQSINRETIERRPFFHNSKNGNQGGPLPFTAKKGGPPEEINHNELDEFGNARSWNAVGNRSNFAGDSWNAWDKQHNAGPCFHMAAAIGSRAGMVNLWNNWRWVITSFFPGSDGDSRGKQFDVPRSVGFGAFLAVYAYMAGFEWADPLMIKFHCGGNSNGDGTGMNGNAGWKPSNYFEWLVKSALGNAVADNGHVQLMPKGFIYWNLGCDNLGEPACLCDCSNAPVPGPGKSGCSGAAWIGPDGVNYGSQTIGIDLWHAGIECSGLMLVDSLNDYIIKTWGPTRSLLTDATRAGLKALLSYASGEAVFRCVDPGTFATSHYYTGTAHSQSESPTTPRGYTLDVANAMLNDMFSCHPEKAVDCSVRALNDGSGQYIVAENSRNKVDLFYSLSMPWLMYVLGPNNPLVKKWLSSGAFIPPPGQDGTTGTQRDNYEFHARFTDFAWALQETGTPVLIQNTSLDFGLGYDGTQSHKVVISQPIDKFGLGIAGSFKKGILVGGGFEKFGLGIAGTAGKGANVDGGVMAFALAFDGGVTQPVYIANSTVQFGMKFVTIPGGSSGPIIIDGNTRMRFGVAIDAFVIHTGGSVIISNPVMGFGIDLSSETFVVWTQSDFEFGIALDSTPDAGKSFTLFNPDLPLGMVMKGRAVVKHKHRFDASGSPITVEG